MRATDFTSNLYKRLPTEKDDSKSALGLLDEVQKRIQMLKKCTDRPSTGMLGNDKLEHEGTNLWNLCTRLTRDGVDGKSKGPESVKLILCSRILAYFVLHISQWSTKQPPHIACHLMRLALKVAKCCIGGQFLTQSRILYLENTASLTPSLRTRRESRRSHRQICSAKSR